MKIENGKQKEPRRVLQSMAANIIGGVVLLLIVFGIVSAAVGLVSFTNVYKKEYTESTYHMADTATALVNGDHIEDYLSGERTEEYENSLRYLDTYCQKMSVSLIYVIRVDEQDYGSFRSVFNCVNNSVDNTSYTPWDLGYEREATNEEYSSKYRALYNQEVPYETVYRFKPSSGLHPHITTLVPVKNSAGEVTALLCIQRPMRELNDARRPYLYNIALSTILLAIAASLISAYIIRRYFVQPIKRVSAEAARFARENTLSRPLGEISRLTEITNLADSIDTMERDMVNYMENLTAITAEKERIGTELALATRIQADMLPNIFPAFPERDEFDIYAMMDPAREVGGDFYDFFLVDDDHLAMVIADVSGKGVPAALFMMMSKILVKNYVMSGNSPARALELVNNTICQNNPNEMFVTIWLGILDIPNGKIVAANAGHEYPMMSRKDGKFEIVQDKHGLVAGVIPDVRYTEYELEFHNGDTLFVYSDGLPEATNGAMEQFGMDRILEVLNQEPDADVEELFANMGMAVAEFSADAPQFDDLTMLVLKGKHLPNG